MTTSDGIRPQRANVRDDNWSQLLHRVGEHRDQAAFEKLFQHFAPMIKGFCLANPNQRLPGEAADELVQEVMLKVWIKAPSYNAAKAAASTWIFTVMRNSRIDLMRRNTRHVINQDGIDIDDVWNEDDDNLPFVRLQQVRDEQLVSTAFKTLPVEQKQALTQVFMQGKSHSEIADETGLPLGTVKSRVRMGLKKLYATLGKR